MFSKAHLPESADNVLDSAKGAHHSSKILPGEFMTLWSVFVHFSEDFRHE
jgi:hypothetical protein